MEKLFNLIMSRKSWDKDRQLNLLAAMAKCVDSGVKIPPEWIDELNDLNERALTNKDDRCSEENNMSQVLPYTA